MVFYSSVHSEPKVEVKVGCLATLLVDEVNGDVGPDQGNPIFPHVPCGRFEGMGRYAVGREANGRRSTAVLTPLAECRGR